MDMTTENLVAALGRVFNVYTKRGFSVRTLLMDEQFEPTRDFCEKCNVDLNTTLRNEHVPDIEHFNQTIKERIHVIHTSMPFEKISKQLVEAIVWHCSRWWNVFVPRIVWVRRLVRMKF